MLQDTLLNLFQTEVVVVELLTCKLQIEVVGCDIIPRKLQHKLQVGHLHRVLRNGRVKTLHLIELLLEQLTHLLRPVLLLGSLTHLLNLGIGGVAKLILNGAHLLLEIVVTLLLVNLALYLLLNLILQLCHLLLTHQNLKQLAGTSQQTWSLQQRLTVVVREVHIRAYEVNQPTR